MIGYQSGLEEFGRSLDERFGAIGNSIDRICEMIKLLDAAVKEVENRVGNMEGARKEESMTGGKGVGQ